MSSGCFFFFFSVTAVLNRVTECSRQQQESGCGCILFFNPGYFPGPNSLPSVFLSSVESLHAPSDVSRPNIDSVFTCLSVLTSHAYNYSSICRIGCLRCAHFLSLSLSLSLCLSPSLSLSLSVSVSLLSIYLLSLPYSLSLSVSLYLYV